MIHGWIVYRIKRGKFLKHGDLTLSRNKTAAPTGEVIDYGSTRAETPGPLGISDSASPDTAAEPGDTPGPTGLNDFGEYVAEDHSRQTRVSPSTPPRCQTGLGLLHFPVQYEPGFNNTRTRTATERAVRVTRSARRGRRCRAVFWIYFDNSFAAPRPHHGGIDIVGPLRSRIVATKDATVVGAWQGGVMRTQPDGSRRLETVTYSSGVGITGEGAYYIRLIDDAGNVHYYAHLNDNPASPPPGLGLPSLSTGSRIRAGQIIGRLGDTGARGIAHLHYQINRAREATGRFSATTPSGTSYSSRGGGRVNPYCELVRLCVRDHGAARSQLKSDRYVIPPPGSTFPPPC